ncbi:MAG: histidine kinase dimerization/phospho-acceptor domain-containing protein [Dysosmobacter welbionis]
MIRKLQIKFVAMCMILVTAVLGVVFTAVFFSAKQNIEVISHQVLQRVMEDDTPSGRPDLGLNRGGEDVLLPYFTVNLWDRSGIYEAFVTGGTYSNLQDTQELQTILTDCLQQNRPEGTIHSYGLRYLRRDYGLYERIAFVDMSMEQATLQEIMGSYLQIGLAALLLLLGVSILLARWATRPVAKAWQQQRQFLSDASHELKTPLTVILSNAELLEAAPLEDRPAVGGQHPLRGRTDEVPGGGDADPGPGGQCGSHGGDGEVSLSDLATDCVLAFEPVAFEAGKPLESDITPDVTVTGDADKLRQLIGVLLDNAIKYGQAGVPSA